MPHVLIVGASRGIGLGLVDVHLEAGWQVHGTTRDGFAPRRHPSLQGYRLDVRDQDQIEALAVDLEEPMDRIIHNAGVLRASPSELTEVNTVAPIRTVEALLTGGRLRSGGSIAIMTSQMGARRGRSGSLGNYGNSKAALNDAFRERAPVWAESGAIAVVIHPGWVKTDMGGRSASLTVAESARGIKTVMDGLTQADHGKFLTWDGRPHSW